VSAAIEFPVPRLMRAAMPAPEAGGARVWGDEVKRVLCLRLDNLGDVLMTTPALHALRAGGKRHLTLLASTAGAALAPLLPDIDEVIIHDAPWVGNTAPHAPRNELLLRDQLSAGQFDAAVIFTVYSQNPLPAAMLCYLAGIPRRLAYCRENPYALLSDWLRETEPMQQVRHEVDRQLDLVGHVGAVTGDTHMRLQVPDDAHRVLGEILLGAGADPRQPWVVLHAGATAPSRRYPIERFAQAAASFIAELDCQLMLTGTTGEQALLQAFIGEIGRIAPACLPQIFDLSGRLGLAEFAALVQDARVLVSNNSGPAHIAAALGTPVVDLYALTNPQHTPWRTPHRLLYADVPCRWCYKSICPEGHHACLNGVAAAQVASATVALYRAPRFAFAADAGNSCAGSAGDLAADLDGIERDPVERDVA
jgi:lipopolysaccharide heptosyltransferase II